MGNHIGGHAVVLGGSIAGSLAARMLSEAYTSVTIIDRDTLFAPIAPRRAIPQGHHIHALLARGQQILDELFPGLTDELVGMGAPIGDFGTSLAWYFNGEMIKKTETGLICLAAGRPMLEDRVRARVNALPNVTYREHTDILGLVASADRSRIIGARVQARAEGSAEEVLEADLVVDATGRASRTPVWLEELGYPRVEDERVGMDLTYTSCDYKSLPDYDPIGDDIALLPVATPAMRRGAIFARMPDRYSLSLTGILGDKPPVDHEGFLAYAKSLPIPDVYRALKDAERLAEPMMFRFPAAIRHRYERMSRLPDGLLAIGDAACVFNPVYGQGMTVASMETEVLGRHLSNGGEPKPLAYFRDLAKVQDAPWDMSTGADLGFPGVTGRRTMKVKMGNVFIPKLQAAATNDGTLTKAFLRTAGLVDPPTALMKPGIISRVLRPRASA